MATITNIIASFAGGLVQVELDYNDANRRMARGRIINDSAEPAWFRITKVSPPVDFSFTVNAGESVERNLPAGLVYRWIDDPDDLTLGTGLSLGDIVIQSRWPA